MAIAALRRISDDILLCNNIVAFSGFEWRFAKPNMRTISGVTRTQRVSSMERWFTLTCEFATDDPVNTIARYDRLAYEANNDFHFRYRHHSGAVYICKCMEFPPIQRLELPTADVVKAEMTMKQVGHVPVLPGQYAAAG